MSAHPCIHDVFARSHSRLAPAPSAPPSSFAGRHLRISIQPLRNYRSFFERTTFDNRSCLGTA
jgi:hypothetical protein